jgi:hypothetical protein
MLKLLDSVKEVERQAASALEALLRRIPAIKLKELRQQNWIPNGGTDLIAKVDASGKTYLLICEVKRNGQPRHVRNAIYRLKSYVTELEKPATPILIAPYLSAAAREICTENEVSFLDFEGNARIAFGTVYIERLQAGKPEPERREFKSLFSPKSAQILRALLREPSQAWKVADLALAARVSLGHVSNVRTALLAREWAEVEPEGLRLTAPDSLLDAWRSNYKAPVAQELRFYTVLHGTSLETAIRDLFANQIADVALSSFSAAQWISPFARTGTQHFYADPGALKGLENKLRLSSPLRGENVIVSIPKDTGIFLDVYEPVQGIRCTSPVQTYLDLSVSGERGLEAAEHLRQTRLKWQN